ncbi:hypothetical protein E6U81_05190 [Streptomyces sp. A0592]|nr:hypothetical protein E6U81_05190 [Streptomyces sp. A0592]
MLLHRGHIRYDDLADDYDDYGVEVTGYPAGWSAAAARAAISADTALLQPLLDGPDRMTRAAFRTRLAAEQDPIVRAGLVLAVAEATRAHPHPPTTAWLRERWRDRTQAPEVRPAAAIGWLCLTREPAPDDLRAAVDHLTTEERARAMETLPWMVSAGATGETGLQRCVRTMLHAERPEPNEDPWAQPR